jgi:hypothetical protein
LSLEHWISHDVLRSFSVDGRLYISGAPWLDGAQVRLPTRRLGANVLCTRHNSALSGLDTMAGQLFRVLYGYQTAQADPDSPARRGTSLIGVFSGPDLERWLLKVLWGGVAAGALGRDGERITMLRSDIDHEALLETLYRGQAWPEGWGLHVGAVPGEPLQEEAPVAIESATGPDGSAWGATVWIGVVGFRLTLGTPDGIGPNLIRQPGGVVLDQQGGAGHRLLALAWPDIGHLIVSYSRLPDAAGRSAPP